MRTRFAALLASVLAGCTSSPPEAQFDLRIPPILERDRIPAAVVVAGGAEGVVYRQAFGTASLDTLFDLASCTKVVATTTAAMLLVEQGKLSLDDPLGKYVACFQGREIRVRDLLLHRAGFPAYLVPKSSTPEEILREFSLLKPEKKEFTYS